MECPPTSTEPASPTRERWIFHYRVDGDLRFISHRDTLRLFQRALARASLPVRYTEGFNPHMRLSIPLPRPVGIASDAETIVVEFAEPVDADSVSQKLRDQMPAGITLTQAKRLQIRGSLQPTRVRYRLELLGAPDPETRSRVRAMMESTRLPVERVGHGKHRARSLDARPYLADMRLDDEAVEFTLRIQAGATVRPAEIATLLGFDAASVTHRIRRLHVEWENRGP